MNVVIIRVNAILIVIVIMMLLVLLSTNFCFMLIAVLFTVLHGMQTWASDEDSVHLSVKHVNCDKTEEVGPDFYTIRKKFSQVC